MKPREDRPSGERIAYLDGLVRRAEAAAAAFTAFTQADVDRIVKPMVLAGQRQAQHLARLAIDETRLGSWSGWSWSSENAQLRRIMAILSEAAPLVDAAGGAGKTIEIEVVTFDKGGKAMDWAGENLAQPVWKWIVWGPDHPKAKQFGKGARGHTAILVGGLAYSYEGTGWRVGLTAQEYMKQATKGRDATSQVLLSLDNTSLGAPSVSVGSKTTLQF